MEKKNIGSSFDCWLRKEGILERVTAAAIERVTARRSEVTKKNEIPNRAKRRSRLS